MDRFIERRANLFVVLFAVTMCILAFIEKAWDFTWLNIFVAILAHILLYGLTALACLSAKHCDRRLEFIIYVVMITSVLVSRATLLYIPTVLFVIFSRKHVEYITYIIANCMIVLTIANFTLLSMIDNDLIVKEVMEEAVSPDGEYVIEQVFHNGYSTGQAVHIFMHKKILNILDISYKIQWNQHLTLSEIEWIDDHTFIVDGVTKEVDYLDVF